MAALLSNGLNRAAARIAAIMEITRREVRSRGDMRFSPRLARCVPSYTRPGGGPLTPLGMGREGTPWTCQTSQGRCDIFLTPRRLSARAICYLEVYAGIAISRPWGQSYYIYNLTNAAPHLIDAGEV